MEFFLDRVSTYSGLFIVMFTTISKEASEILFPMSINICIYGVLETLLTEHKATTKLASLVGHILMPLLCMIHEPPILRKKWMVMHAVLFLIACLIYAQLDAWPYVITIAFSFMFMIPLQVLLFSRLRITN